MRVGHWWAVNCTYRGHRQPIRQGPTGKLSIVHTEGTGNQPGRGKAGHRWNKQPDRQGAHTVRHTGALGQCQLYIQRALTTSQTGVHLEALPTVHREGTGNQSMWVRLGAEGTVNQTDRGHTLGHWRLYIQRTQTTSPTGAQWGTIYSPLEGTGNQLGGEA